MLTHARRPTLFPLVLVLATALALPAIAAERTVDDAASTLSEAPSRADADADRKTVRAGKGKAVKAKRRRGKRKRRAKRLSKRERKVLKLARAMNVGSDRKAIDSAFDAGALTWGEAKALYAEQGLVRLAFIAHRDHPEGNLARVQFMRRTAQTSLLRLRYNLAQRIYVDVPEGETSSAEDRALASHR